jgi:hypothetical protein
MYGRVNNYVYYYVLFIWRFKKCTDDIWKRSQKAQKMRFKEQSAAILFLKVNSLTGETDNVL